MPADDATDATLDYDLDLPPDGTPVPANAPRGLRRLFHAWRGTRGWPAGELLRGHDCVVVRLGARAAVIDVALAPLVRSLWALDVDTRFCCEDQRHPEDRRRPTVYLQFGAVAGLDRFLGLVLAGTPDRSPLRARVLSLVYFDADGTESDVPSPHAAGTWRFDLNVFPDDAPPGFRLVPMVWFPRADLPAVTAILTAAAEAAARR